MLNVFVDVCETVRLAVIKNGNVILLQKFVINDKTSQEIIYTLKGLEIDHLCFSIPGFYSKTPIDGVCTPFKIQLADKEFFCNISLADLEYLQTISKSLRYTKCRFMERSGFWMSAIKANTIIVDPYKNHTQFYISRENSGDFYYVDAADANQVLAELQEKYGNFRVTKARSLNSPQLLSYVKNKNSIQSDEMEDIKNFLSLCLFSLSNSAKKFVFNYEKTAPHKAVATEESTHMLDPIEKTTPKLAKERYIPKKQSHSVYKEKYFKWVFLFTVFCNVCLLGVATFCQRDVVALTKQSSQKTIELNELSKKIQLLKDGETKRVDSTQIEQLITILKKDLGVSVGEIAVNWEGQTSILVYVEVLDKAEQLKLKISEISAECVYNSEGTIIINNKLWYKIRFTL